MHAHRSTTKDHRATIERLAARSFASHRLTEAGTLQDTTIWYCAGTNGGAYAFRVLAWPGFVLVVGDVGNTLFRHSDAYSRNWIKAAVSDADYALGKVVSPQRVFMLGDAAAFIDEIARSDGNQDRAQQIRVMWARDGQSPDGFTRALVAADIDEPPDCTDYDASHLWAVEALRVFVRLLNAAASTQEPKP